MEEHLKERHTSHKIANIGVSILGIIFILSFGFILLENGHFNDVKDQIVAARTKTTEINLPQAEVAGVETKDEPKSSPVEGINTTNIHTPETSTLTPESIKVKIPLTYSETVNSGDGVSNLVRRALNSFLSDNSINLTIERKLYSEVTLTNQNQPFTIYAGQVRNFSSSSIKQVVDSSNNLTQVELNAWRRRVLISNYK